MCQVSNVTVQMRTEASIMAIDPAFLNTCPGLCFMLHPPRSMVPKGFSNHRCPTVLQEIENINTRIESINAAMEATYRGHRGTSALVEDLPKLQGSAH